MITAYTVVLATVATVTTPLSVTPPTISAFPPLAPPRDPIPYYIVEELPIGTLIGSVPVDAMLDRRYDRRRLEILRYKLVGQKIAASGNVVDLFEVDEVTGIVRTLVQIDRDELCAASPVCIVQLDIIIRPGLSAIHRAGLGRLALARWAAGNYLPFPQGVFTPPPKKKLF